MVHRGLSVGFAAYDVNGDGEKLDAIHVCQLSLAFGTLHDCNLNALQVIPGNACDANPGIWLMLDVVHTMAYLLSHPPPGGMIEWLPLERKVNLPFLVVQPWCDKDTGDVLLKVDASLRDQPKAEFRIVYRLPPGFPRPVHPTFISLFPGESFHVLADED